MKFEDNLVQHETAHDWEAEKNRKKSFFDDGHLSFFWNAHTITVLFIFSAVLLYETILNPSVDDSQINMKKGIIAVIVSFVAVGVIHMPDGPFCRPHPAFWRLILCLSIVYEMGLIFLLFQNVSDARQMLKVFDNTLGLPLEEKEYGGACYIYDSNHTDPFHNVWDKMDGFVATHFIGWFLKTLILRDYWLCNVLSLMFECLEYTLEHQLPNFSECWWDHWLMDFLICNLAGIYLGMKALEYLSIKPYQWSSMWHIKGYKGKMKRVVMQFTPKIWTDFDWRPFDSLKRWLGVLVLILLFLLAELNTFYMKFILWIPPPHFLCLGRLVFFLFMGAVAIRQYFQFLDDPHTHKLGDQCWLICAIIFTETFICIKFDWNTVTKPIPGYIMTTWIVGLLILFSWTFWHFFIKRWMLIASSKKLKKSQKDQNQSNGQLAKDKANGKSYGKLHKDTDVNNNYSKQINQSHTNNVTKRK